MIRLLHAKVRDLVQTSLDPISLQVETEETIPEQMVQAMRRLGLFGMPVPRAYGGLGLTTVGRSRSAVAALCWTYVCWKLPRATRSSWSRGHW